MIEATATHHRHLLKCRRVGQRVDGSRPRRALAAQQEPELLAVAAGKCCVDERYRSNQLHTNHRHCSKVGVSGSGLAGPDHAATAQQELSLVAVTPYKDD